MDLINECEKLGDYVVNVVEARMGQRQKDACGGGPYGPAPERRLTTTFRNLKK